MKSLKNVLAAFAFILAAGVAMAFTTNSVASTPLYSNDGCIPTCFLESTDPCGAPTGLYHLDSNCLDEPETRTPQFEE